MHDVAVDLQNIGMAVDDHLVVGSADAEVVDGDAHAGVAQQIERGEERLDRPRGAVLEHFEHEVVGRDPVGLRRGEDAVAEVIDARQRRAVDVDGE